MTRGRQTWLYFFLNISEPLQRKTCESALKIDDRFLPHSLQFMSEIHATIQHYINGTLHKASLKLSEVCKRRLASTDIILGCLVLFLFGAEDNKWNRNVSPYKLNLKQDLWHCHNRNFNLSCKQSNINVHLNTNLKENS